MWNWLKETKDGDKIALFLLLTGVFMLFAGTGVMLFAIFKIDNEAKLDRALLALAGIGSQGSGLITAGMGVLRFQQKSGPATDVPSLPEPKPTGETKTP